MGLFVLLLAFSLIYFAISLISAGRTLKSYNQRYGTSDEDPPVVTFVPYHMAFLEARNTLSKVDSVSLSINLADTVASLEMGGVVVFTAPLEGSRVSPLLKAMKPEALSNLLRSPARVLTYHATIEKEPVTVKQAPRDTTEAAQNDEELPVVTRKAAFFTLHLDNGIHIVVMPHDEGGLRRVVYTARQNLYLFGQRLAVLVKGELPHDVPVITIEVSADDARTLFRALPEKAQVALRL
jgi:hypothetical protein